MLAATYNVFPSYSLDTSILVAVLIGVLILAFLTETLGWVFVGLVVPGYLASVFVVHPETGATVVVEALVTYGFAVLLSSVASRTGVWSEFFGRDRFFAILLASVLVREVFEIAVLPRFGVWMDTKYGTTFALDRTLHSIGLVLVPLTANGFWKLGLRKGAFQVGVPVLLTFAILQFVLLPATNLSFSSLELMYEDIARSFLASPKAYILLLVTAVLAARFNIRYGWDFNGILVPALIALTWLSPTKLVGTLAEVAVLVVMTRALLSLPGIRTLNLEGPRKTVLVFVLGFALKWAIGWALGGRVPGLKVTDLFGFGYLVPTLLAVKILQKQVAARVSLAAVHTSIAGFLIGSLIGFDLSIFEPKTADASSATALRVDDAPLLSRSELGVAALARASSRQQQGAQPPMPTNRRTLREYGALWEGVERWLSQAPSDDTAQPRNLQQQAAASGLWLRELPSASRRTWVLNERTTLSGRRGFDTALLMPGATGPVLLVPRPVSEAPTAEASVALCARVLCRAILFSGLDTKAEGASRGDALNSASTPLQTAAAALGAHERIILRADSDAVLGKPTLYRPVDDGGFAALWPSALRSQQPPLEPGYDWGTARLSMFVAHPNDLVELVGQAAPEQGAALTDADVLRAFSPQLSATSTSKTPTEPSLSDDELLVLDQLVASLITDGAGPLSTRWSATMAALFGLELRPLQPCGTGARCFVLKPCEGEPLAVSATLVFRSDGAPIALQVPAPGRERGTPHFALELSRQLRARAVLLAGLKATPSVGEPVRTAFHAYYQALHRQLPQDGLSLQLRGFDPKPGSASHSVVVALDRPVLEEKDRLAQVDAVFAPTGPLSHLGDQMIYADGSLPLAWASEGSAQQLFVRTFGGARMATLWLSAQARGAYLPMRFVDEQLTALNLSQQSQSVGALMLAPGLLPLSTTASVATQQRVEELQRLAERLLSTQNPHGLQALVGPGSSHPRWRTQLFRSDEAAMPVLFIEAAESGQQIRAVYFLQEYPAAPLRLDLTADSVLAGANVEAALRQRRPLILVGKASGAEGRP